MSTVPVRYVGPSKGRTIAATGQHCLRGASVDVDPDLASELVATGDWDIAPPESPPPDLPPPDLDGDTTTPDDAGDGGED
jgi:hypothetical protein